MAESLMVIIQAFLAKGVKAGQDPWIEDSLSFL